MHQDLKIKALELAKADDTWDYLYLILEAYYKLWDAEPDKVVDNFTDNQHALLAYTTLYNQVQNGGFLQLLFNGYGDYIFDSPLIETLKEWGAFDSANVLDKIKPICLEVKNQIRTENSTLDDFSAVYMQYPEFDEYDEEFYDHDDLDEVKSYVENHLNEFVIIE